MKIIKIVKKDLKLFRRDTKTLALTIIAPIIILLILGNVFGQNTGSNAISGLKLGLCDLDEEKTNINISIFIIEPMRGNCEYAAHDFVSNGKLRAAIVIPKDFTKNIREGYGSQITLYVDNSKTQTALFASDAIKAFVQELNERIGTEFIEEAWVNLKDLNVKLKMVVSNLEIARNQAVNIQNTLNQINDNVRRINIVELEGQINNLNNSLSNISSMNINLSSQMGEQISQLRLFYNGNCPGGLTEEQCKTINITINQLENINNNIAEREDSINNLLRTTNTTELSNGLETIRESRGNITSELIRINGTISNYTNNLIDTIDDLNRTTQLLDTYTSRDPKNIVRAVTLNENPVFGDKTYFEFLAPGLILIILLFTIVLVSSSNIVYERKTGTLARTLLSPTPLPILIMSKVIFFSLVSALEIIIMFLVIKAFGINISVTPLVLLILLISSINFIILGLLLGALSSSENTALLSSLVVALPMLFLSNLFFPFEIMPKFMKLIGTNLPLTLSIESLDKLVIYSSHIEAITILKLILIPLVLVLLTYIFIKRNPTPE